MNFLANGLDKLAGACVGTVAFAFGVLPAGVGETVVGLAGVTGCVLGNQEKYSLENQRVQARIRKAILAGYEQYIEVEGDDWVLKADLAAADAALQRHMDACRLDRKTLAQSAVTSEGFPTKAVALIMEQLAAADPSLFAQEALDGLPYRYARDVITAGIEEAATNPDFYRQLEPHLMTELARSVAVIGHDAARAANASEALLERYGPQIDFLTKELHATQSDLLQLLGHILQDRVAPADIQAAITKAWEKLKDLRSERGNWAGLSNEEPEIAPLLKQADDALAEGSGFSLEKAEKALATADKRYAEINEARDESAKRAAEVLKTEQEQAKNGKINRAKIIGKRAEMAALKFAYLEAADLYQEQAKLREQAFGAESEEHAYSLNQTAFYLDDAGLHSKAEPFYRQSLEIRQRVLGEDHPNTATSYNNVAFCINAQGRHKEAEPLYRKSLEISQRVLGGDHPDTATSYNNVACNLAVRGLWKEGLPFFEKAYEIISEILGNAHPKSQWALENLNHTRAQLGLPPHTLT